MSNLEICSLKVRVAKAHPIGGVLSPLLWSLVVDDLLSGLIWEYADDIYILGLGRFPGMITDLVRGVSEGWKRGLG